MENLQFINYDYNMLFTNCVNIVRLSFLAQKSITYLDLSTCELTFKYQSVFTHEGLIKHLDKFPGSIHNALSSRNSFHIALEAKVKAYVSQLVYTQHLAKDIVNHIRKSNHKQKEWLKLLRPMFMIGLFQEYFSWKIIFEYSIELFFNDSLNSYLILKIVAPEYFTKWILTTNKPKVVDFILRHFDARRIDIWNFKYLNGRAKDPVIGCLTFGQMDHVAVLLKYRNSPNLYLRHFLKEMCLFIETEL